MQSRRLARPVRDLMSAGHVCLFGRTQSGKTHLARNILRGWKGPALCINTQAEEMPGVIVPDSAELGLIMRRLRQGAHLNLVPPADDAQARLVLDALIPRLIGASEWRPELLLIVDEAHVYAPQGRMSVLHLIARRGLRWGVRGVWISQRPADVDKGLVTQATRHVVFETSWEGPYFQRYGIDQDKVRELLNQGGQYSYAVYDGGALAGPFKEAA